MRPWWKLPEPAGKEKIHGSVEIHSDFLVVPFSFRHHEVDFLRNGFLFRVGKGIQASFETVDYALESGIGVLKGDLVESVLRAFHRIFRGGNLRLRRSAVFFRGRHPCWVNEYPPSIPFRHGNANKRLLRNAYFTIEGRFDGAAARAMHAVLMAHVPMVRHSSAVGFLIGLPMMAETLQDSAAPVAVSAAQTLGSCSF